MTAHGASAESVRTSAVGDRDARPADAMDYRVLSIRSIWLAAASVVAVGVGVSIWLLLSFGREGEQARNQLEAVKTAGTIIVGTGGAVALLLAARRQRSTEIALKQKDRDQFDAARAHALQERLAATNEADAVARRVTELYAKSVEQLGSENAPIRLGGLYALERLAQENAVHRQTVVNVLCAYLRMPAFGVSESQDGGEAHISQQRMFVQERQVRLAAQGILWTHLRPGPDLVDVSPSFWQGIELDLSGAVLENFRLSGCRIESCWMYDTKFEGFANFNGTTFSGPAAFNGAHFTGEVQFTDSSFSQDLGVERVTFEHGADFSGAHFGARVGFGSAEFRGDAIFAKCRFDGMVWFSGAQFIGAKAFSAARFDGGLAINGTIFGQEVPPELSEIAGRSLDANGDPRQASRQQLEDL